MATLSELAKDYPCCVYKLISPSGKVYIGITNSFNRRMKEHNKCSSDTVLSRAILKYGFENFNKEILLFGSSVYCQEMEIAFIKKWNSIAPNGMNICSGGQRFDPRGENHHCYGKFGANHPAFGNKLSDEVKRKISEFQTGRKRSNETKKKMSDVKKGNLYNLGRKYSDETKKKISDSQKGENNHLFGKHHSEETKVKMRESHAVISDLTSITTRKQYGTEFERYQLNDGRIFNSAKECADAIGAYQENVRSVALGKRKTVNGFTVILIKPEGNQMSHAGVNMHKELAMPEYHKEAAKEAVGNAPESFPGMKEKKVKNVDKGGGPCGVKHQK
jgi:group I intron endonuclease